MLHVLVSGLLIIVVLLQSGKGEGLAGAFGGGGGSGAVFGGRGTANFLTRTTTVLAIAFMVNCLILTMLSVGRSGAPRSVLQEQNVDQQIAPPVSAPAVADTAEAAPNPFAQ
jgi:preprotein translocase subunit SecG